MRVPIVMIPLAVASTLVGCDPPTVDHQGFGDDMFTIADLERAGAGLCTDGAGCPVVGARVAVDDVVVTAVDTYDEDGQGRVGNVWVQDWVTDPAQRAWTGVQLFAPTVIPGRTDLQPGDIVRVVGTLDEFVLLDDAGNPMDTDGTLTEMTEASAQKTGEALPLGPVTIAGTDLGNLSAAEPWEGVLVRVANVQMAGAYDSRGEAETSWGWVIANDLYEIPGLADGTTFAAVTGVVTYFFGFKILPRGPEDVER
jgi:hypothetical protein